MFGRWPDYTYDDSFGVKIMYQDAGITKEIFLGKAELDAIQEAKSADLFYNIEQRFRQKFSAERPESPL
jgi:hypothetical protein